MNSWTQSLQKYLNGLRLQLSYFISPSLKKYMPDSQKLYSEAKKCLGRHITLDEAVPRDVGCAESVSYVLKQAGVSDGPQGIAGTAALYQWMAASPLFMPLQAPEAGAILISPTGSGNGSVEGHTGILGEFSAQFPSDWGVMSNDSATGLFLERWSLERWIAYYSRLGGLPMHYFRYVGISL